MDAPRLAARPTAVVGLSLPGAPTGEALALDRDREYELEVSIEGRGQGGGRFQSPLGDERWRDVVEAMRQSASGEPSRARFNRVFDAGKRLFDTLADAGPEVRRFLEEPGAPRRLVVASDRPEIHRLPWEAMIGPKNQLVAESGLSVVHADRYGFDPMAQVTGGRLALAYLVGPDAPGTTRAVVEELARVASATEGRGLSLSALPAAAGKDLRAALGGSAADIVQVEAHGDNTTGTIRLAPDLDADPREIAALIGRRLMVLFWSCFSGLMHSWGESPGLTLHRNETPLVVGFSTELRYETAAAIARRVYAALFDPRGGGDIESILVSERARLWREAEAECVWAALTIWMRRPLDLSAALSDGPRLPDDAWTAEAAVAAVPEIASALPGRIEIVSGRQLPDRLARGAVADVRGAAVRLRGPAATAGQVDALLAHHFPETRPASPHTADGVLALLGALSTYPGSLLLWSGIGQRELNFFHLLGDVAPRLAVLLVTPRPITAFGPGLATDPITVAGDDLDALEALVDAGHLAEAGKRWQALAGAAEAWPRESPERYLRYHRAGYWARVKVGDLTAARASVGAMEEQVRTVGDDGYALRFESRLLTANLAVRQGLYDQGRSTYVEARALAGGKGNKRDYGRATQELAALAAELGDAVLAERLYQEALRSLTEAAADREDPLWRSAIGRLLRDYADLLASDPARAPESRRLVCRAIAIHTLDGRYEQLAAALRTRGRLAATETRWDAAEKDLEASAAICATSGNWVGWVSSMREAALLASSRGCFAQAREVLTRLLDYLGTEGAVGRGSTGMVAAHLARVSWRLGELEAVIQSCDRAAGALPEARWRERAEVRNLAEAACSLLGKDAQASTEEDWAWEAEPLFDLRGRRRRRSRSRRPDTGSRPSSTSY